MKIKNKNSLIFSAFEPVSSKIEDVFGQVKKWVKLSSHFWSGGRQFDTAEFSKRALFFGRNVILLLAKGALEEALAVTLEKS